MDAVLRVQVVRMHRHMAQALGVPHHQRAAGQPHVERLVEVHRHRVRTVQPRQLVARRRARGEDPAHGRVRMDPHPVAFGDVGDGRQPVDGAAVGGPQRRDDGHRHGTGGHLTFDRLGQGPGVQTPGGVGGDDDHGVATQPEQAGCLGDAVVRGGADEDAQRAEHLGGQVGEPGVAGEALHGAAAGQRHGLQVGGRPSGGEDAVARGEPAPASDLGQEPLLHERRGAGLVPGLDRRVERPEHGVRCGAGEQDRAVEVSGIARVVVGGGLVGVELRDLGEGVVEAARRLREVDGADGVGQVRRRGVRVDPRAVVGGVDGHPGRPAGGVEVGGGIAESEQAREHGRAFREGVVGSGRRAPRTSRTVGKPYLRKQIRNNDVTYSKGGLQQR